MNKKYLREISGVVYGIKKFMKYMAIKIFAVFNLFHNQHLEDEHISCNFKFFFFHIFTFLYSLFATWIAGLLMNILDNKLNVNVSHNDM